jgi:ATP-dependent RNA helicase DHX29
MPGMGEIRRLNDLLLEHPCFGLVEDFKIYPLHSTLSSENQSAVFDIPPPGVRKIVIGLWNTAQQFNCRLTLI